MVCSLGLNCVLKLGVQLKGTLHILLCPNLAVFELAPTTAMLADERNVLMDASVLMLGKMRLQVTRLETIESYGEDLD